MANKKNRNKSRDTMPLNNTKKNNKKDNTKAKSKTSTKGKKDNSSKKTSIENPHKSGIANEIAAIVMIAFGAFFVISLHTELAGAVGGIMADLFKGLFGIGAFIIAYIVVLYGFLVLLKLVPVFRVSSFIMLLILFIGVLILNSARFLSSTTGWTLNYADVFKQGAELKNGGLVGTYMDFYLKEGIGSGGIYILGITLIIISLLMLMDTPVSRFFEKGREFRESRKQRRLEKVMAREESEVNSESENPKVVQFEDNENVFEMQTDENDSQIYNDNDSILNHAYANTNTNAKESDNGFLDKLRNLASSGKEERKRQEGNINKDKWGEALSNNKRNILNLLDNERDALGNAFAETTSDTPSDLLKSEDNEKDDDFNGFVDHSNDFNRDIMIGGASVATKKSATESVDGDVCVSPLRRSRYRLPSLDLLATPQHETVKKESRENISAKASLLEKTLKSFGVDAKVVNVISGPSVTRYEIQPQIGVKVQSITRLTDDIALNMRARSIRIEAPIPGKAAVGIEIENEVRQSVTIREIIGSPTFRNHKSKLAFSVGRDIGGNPVVADLGKMPHLLIAGATGSGKSVCINTIIASILYKARPEEVRLILIDPKMVELGNYNGIPHLLIPVVTDANNAAGALNWAVAEMTERYKKFASMGVRDIGAYNQKMKTDMKKDEILPQIVIIIDELSDLMMVASNQVEDAICRLAQLARAAGLHLIVATQRPSVDVITGLIKANIPSRIAFMVSSQIDSRTILDMNGAEKLVGNGDMLFKPQDLNKPKRIQGPFISDDEVSALIEYVKSQVADAQYDDAVIEKIEKGKGFSDSDEEDELLLDAIGVVVNAGQASVSMLQRRFRIGYNRAARIVDIMQARGIVGPQDGSRPRQVLITEDEYNSMKKDRGEII